ncbi:MAG TPA: pilin [Candidatus Paceibacterota bacterium]|nr:pilin [Candidatus Paceibacterota bacterium]
MKKYPLSTAFLIVFVMMGAAAHASAASGVYCPSNTSNGGTYCSSNQVCDYEQGVCVSSSNTSSFTSQPAQSANNTGFTALAPIPGLTGTSTTAVVNSATLANFFNNLYKYLIGMAAALAVIEIIWGGLEISTKDSVSKKTDGKERVYNAIFGLVLVLSPVLVFSIINPAILNLSLDLPKLDTAPGTAASGSTSNMGAQTYAIDPTTGCSVTGTNYLLTATCSSPTGIPDAKASATTWLSNNCNFSTADNASPTCSSSNSSGCTLATASCEKASASSYVLINIGTDFNPNLEPFDAQTSSSISRFISGCNGDGGNVCVYTGSLETAKTTCPNYTTSLPKSAARTCTNQSLYCFNSADTVTANSQFHLLGISVPTTGLSTSFFYACPPTLKFTLQPLQ